MIQLAALEAQIAHRRRMMSGASYPATVQLSADTAEVLVTIAKLAKSRQEHDSWTGFGGLEGQALREALAEVE